MTRRNSWCSICLIYLFFICIFFFFFWVQYLRNSCAAVTVSSCATAAISSSISSSEYFDIFRPGGCTKSDRMYEIDWPRATAKFQLTLGTKRWLHARATSVFGSGDRWFWPKTYHCVHGMRPPIVFLYRASAAATAPQVGFLNVGSRRAFASLENPSIFNRAELWPIKPASERTTFAFRLAAFGQAKIAKPPMTTGSGRQVTTTTNDRATQQPCSLLLFALSI